MAIDPSLVADNDERVPRKPPIGVQATPTMHTSVWIAWWMFRWETILIIGNFFIKKKHWKE